MVVLGGAVVQSVIPKIRSDGSMWDTDTTFGRFVAVAPLSRRCSSDSMTASARR